MSKPRPFRFGVSVHGSKSGPEWRGMARQAEELGYSTLLLPDHLGDQLSPIPALVAAAGATNTLRVGSLVFDNDFRHPAMLAKEAATLDVLSEGRLELGVGAGWLKPEYDQAGIPFERAGGRIARMEEAIRIVKGLFADGPVDFAGQYYTITGLEGFPKPVQRPHPVLATWDTRSKNRHLETEKDSLCWFANIGRSKSELIAENALLRKPLIILRRQVKRPTCTNTDRILLVLLARLVRTWQQALVIV